MQVIWTIPPQYAIANNTTVEVKREIWNGSWLTGGADSGGAPASSGVEVRFGASGWYPATDVSSNGDWSFWKIQVPPEAAKGNQTLSARLVVAPDRMSPIDSASVLLLNEYAPAPAGGDASFWSVGRVALIIGVAALLSGLGSFALWIRRPM